MKANFVAVGPREACLVTTGGSVECWGAGNSDPVPTPVSGLPSGVTALSAGNANVLCALTAGGEVVCTNGGNVPGLESGVTAVSVADNACALAAGGAVSCWLPGNPAPPSMVTGLTSGVKAVAAGAGISGDYDCAVTAAGVVDCWGNYPGYGTGPGSSAPMPISGLSGGIAAIAAGSVSACALTASGGVECFGGGTTGQLGNGANMATTAALQVTGLTSGVTSVSGDGTWCALTASGGVECWGNNANGRLGNGSTVPFSTVPVQVTGLTSGVTSLSAGGIVACAVTSSGQVMCWGDNTYGGLGIGTTGVGTSSSVPVEVTGF